MSNRRPVFRATPNVSPLNAPIEPWARCLADGDAEGAWSTFLDAYRNLIFATIGRVVRDAEARMDVFALVCERLRERDYHRLRAFKPDGPARFSTWLVTVVRNIAVDWHRGIHGRQRGHALKGRLSAFQEALLGAISGTGMTYVEAYESLRSAGSFSGSFAAFLRQVRELYLAAFAHAGPLAAELIGCDPAVEVAGQVTVAPDPPEDHERVHAALATLPDDVRAATLLFVVDGVPADQVARIVGWPNRKAVYNRVHRALGALRLRLGREAS